MPQRAKGPLWERPAGSSVRGPRTTNASASLGPRKSPMHNPRWCSLNSRLSSRMRRAPSSLSPAWQSTAYAPPLVTAWCVGLRHVEIYKSLPAPVGWLLYLLRSQSLGAFVVRADRRTMSNRKPFLQFLTRLFPDSFLCGEKRFPPQCWDFESGDCPSSFWIDREFDVSPAFAYLFFPYDLANSPNCRHIVSFLGRFNAFPK